MSERDVLKASLAILKRVFKSYVHVERRNVGMFTNPYGQMIRIGQKGESDIGGHVTRGPYIGQRLAIEVKRSDFRPGKLTGKEKKRFLEQCDYLRKIQAEGGVGLWLNDPASLYQALIPVLVRGARVSLDSNNSVLIHT